jgi:glycosyltransferase involved in cell wall biosynthesis
MTRPEVPDAIRKIADARSAARRAHNWAEADRLRAQLDEAGWKVADAGSLYILERSVAPDVVVDGVTRYGASESVPSRLDEPAIGVATVVTVATDWPEDLARFLAAVLGRAGDGLQVIVVANAPSETQEAELASMPQGVEVVWLATRLGHASALNAGLRRAMAPVVIIADTSIEPDGDLPSALAAALADPTVAVAGPFGIVSDDLRHFSEPADGQTDVDVIEGYALAFRRADYIARGPLDEHFVFYRNLDVWWSFGLRDYGEDDAEDALPRRALRVTSVPVARHAHRGAAGLSEPMREKLAKKNFYRFLKIFATRRDLLVNASAEDAGFGDADVDGADAEDDA